MIQLVNLKIEIIRKTCKQPILAGFLLQKSPVSIPPSSLPAKKKSQIIIQDVSNHVLKRFWVFKGETLTHQFTEAKTS